MQIINSKSFSNGIVYALQLEDGLPIECTDTFLPEYTKYCINNHTNELIDSKVGNRNERWMIGVSVMSGCPVHCKFCATGKLKQFRNLTATEIYQQVEFITQRNKEDFSESKEHKINYTRMGEPFLNIENVKKAVGMIEERFPNTHHFVSTIGIKDSDFSWIKGNISLQISVHSLREETRNELIPFPKMSLKELGQIRTNSNLKTTVNMTLVDKNDFDIKLLREYFDPEYFFIKLSPLNENFLTKKNHLTGIIDRENFKEVYDGRDFKTASRRRI